MEYLGRTYITAFSVGITDLEGLQGCVEFRKGLVETELEPIVQSLRPGIISEPTKTDRGYYLVKVSPLEPEILQADQATRERLRQELLAEKRRKRLDDMFSELKAGATIRLADASRYVTDDSVQTRSTP